MGPERESMTSTANTEINRKGRRNEEETERKMCERVREREEREEREERAEREYNEERRVRDEKPFHFQSMLCIHTTGT